LAVHALLDILDDNWGLGVEGFYLNPPEGDDSDGYDSSDTEEGNPDTRYQIQIQKISISDISCQKTTYVRKKLVSNAYVYESHLSSVFF
jgi:hypothetical protein